MISVDTSKISYGFGSKSELIRSALDIYTRQSGDTEQEVYDAAANATNGHCFLCGKRIIDDNGNHIPKTGRPTWDHFFPLKDFNLLVKGNTLLACQSCNSSKNGGDPFEHYKALLEDPTKTTYFKSMKELEDFIEEYSVAYKMNYTDFYWVGQKNLRGELSDQEKEEWFMKHVLNQITIFGDRINNTQRKHKENREYDFWLALGAYDSTSSNSSALTRLSRLFEQRKISALTSNKLEIVNTLTEFYNTDSEGYSETRTISTKYALNKYIKNTGNNDLYPFLPMLSPEIGVKHPDYKLWNAKHKFLMTNNINKMTEWRKLSRAFAHIDTSIREMNDIEIVYILDKLSDEYLEDIDSHKDKKNQSAKYAVAKNLIIELLSLIDKEYLLKEMRNKVADSIQLSDSRDLWLSMLDKTTDATVSANIRKLADFASHWNGPLQDISEGQALLFGEMISKMSSAGTTVGLFVNAVDNIEINRVLMNEYYDKTWGLNLHPDFETWDKLNSMKATTVNKSDITQISLLFFDEEILSMDMDEVEDIINQSDVKTSKGNLIKNIKTLQEQADESDLNSY